MVHKHAKVAKAWIDGAIIESRQAGSSLSWKLCGAIGSDTAPAFFDDCEYRIVGFQFDTTKKYLDSLSLSQALWWFIENVDPEDPTRLELFFHLRVRYQREPHP
jgi:hypothetical protein